ncbi:INO80 complex subunit D-like [Zingiber officinale]|uniref:INO80 complex subunit D-like n=1 Tax=Zingiber officinale TaxID=94328 RepID=UPI001C4D88FB|nr:INO80 complex subunit D-like [Zingiber officinale]
MSSARKGKAPKRSEWNPNLNSCRAEESVAGPSVFTIDGAEEDEILCPSRSLTREEVLRRRSRRVKQLALCYRRQYWALMEEVRVKHRQYYWEYGVSPFECGDKEVEEEEPEQDKGEEDGLNRGRVAEENGEETEATRKGRRVQLGFDEGNGGVGNIGQRKRCAFPGCKTNAMALTNYCHPHILSEKRQTLYKPCIHVIKRSKNGEPITCAKPILVDAIPSLCHIHLQKYQTSISQALRKHGVNIPSGKPVPKLSAIIAESVRQIQAKRKEALKNSSKDTMDQKDEEIQKDEI